MEIKQVKDNKRDYMGLLLDADPNEEMINKYLDKGDMFILKVGDVVLCEAVVTEVSEDVCELKNIATFEPFRDRGYATEMIKFLTSYYYGKYKEMIVGTAENGGGFYLKQGFEYSHTVKNFFIDNYPEPVIDNGFECRDMVYYKKKIQ